MTHHILNNKYDEYDIVVVFANTGREREETLEFVRDCDRYLGFNTVWVESVVHHEERKGSTHKVVTFETASRDGAPFEDVVKKYGIPNVDFLHCTRELKTNPIHSYIKSIWEDDYLTAIGIRADEVDRIKKGKYFYPLIKMGIRKEDIRAFWKQMPFDLGLVEDEKLGTYEGNCKDCFKKTLKKLIQIQRDRREGKVEPDDWGQRMETKYENHVPGGQQAGRQVPIRFNRKNISYKEIDDLSKLSDEEIKKKTSRKKIDLNLSNGCSESCEAF